MDKLKLCPFCGGETEIYKRKDSPCRYSDGKARLRFYPTCRDSKCLGRNLGKGFLTEKEAIETWNRRVNDEM